MVPAAHPHPEIPKVPSPPGVKVLNITISDRNFIFCFAYFFVRASVHVYFDILSLVFLELGRLMLSVCLTMIQLFCC